MAYPVTFDVQTPPQFDKAQVVLRIVIFVFVAWVLNGVIGAAYWVLPIIAAVMIAQKGAEAYLSEAQTGPVRWVRFIVGIYSYMALATDKISFERPEEAVSFEVRTSGTPTVGSALLRIILGIPHAIVLGLLGIVFVVVWIVAAFSILTSSAVPEWATGYIRGYLRWNARVLAYMASLVDEYPPFSFEDGGAVAPASPPPTASA